MVTRYDVAMSFKEQWKLLSWKGDDHTYGIYFNGTHGYLTERTYTVRMTHDECAPSVFYIPGDEEDEVTTEFPYRDMVKKPNKYHFLFKGPQLEENQLEDLFEAENQFTVEVNIDKIIALLEGLPKKRERDRSWITIRIDPTQSTAAIYQKKTTAFEEVERVDLEQRGQEGDEVYQMTVNANSLLHALNLFNCDATISFSKSRDRIRLTSENSTPKVEALISLPKETIRTEIENRPSK